MRSLSPASPILVTPHLMRVFKIQKRDNYIVIHENPHDAKMMAQHEYDLFNAAQDWVLGDPRAITKRNKFLKAARLIKAIF